MSHVVPLKLVEGQEWPWYHVETFHFIIVGRPSAWTVWVCKVCKLVENCGALVHDVWNEMAESIVPLKTSQKKFSKERKSKTVWPGKACGIQGASIEKDWQELPPSEGKKRKESFLLRKHTNKSWQRLKFKGVNRQPDR